MTAAKKAESKSAFDAQRGNIFYFDPDDIIIIGIDKYEGKIHKRGEHKQWDPRVELPLKPDFVAGIQKFGVLVDCLVYKDGDFAIAVDGRQRIRAAREANKVRRKHKAEIIKVPCKKITAAEADLMAVMALVNEHRTDDTVLDKAEKACNLKLTGYNDESIRMVFQLDSQKSLDNWLLLHAANEKVKDAVRKELINATVGITIAALPKSEQEAQLNEFLKAKSEGVKVTAAVAKATIQHKRARTSTPKVEDDGEQTEALREEHGEEADSDVIVPPSKALIKKVIAAYATEKGPFNKMPEAAIQALKWVAGEFNDLAFVGLRTSLKKIAEEDAKKKKS